MTAGRAVGISSPEEAETLALNAIWRQANRLAGSKLVPKVLHGQPADVLLVLLHGQQLGLPTTQALIQLYPIEGRVVPSAQLQAALVVRAGHELRIEEASRESCTVAIRRAGTDYWQRATWTMDGARRAGLLDRWVQRWQKSSSGKSYKQTYVVGSTEPPPEWAAKLIAADEVHRKENWWRYPDDMLRARAISRAARAICPDALMGLGGEESYTAEELGLNEGESEIDQVVLDEGRGPDALEPARHGSGAPDEPTAQAVEPAAEVADEPGPSIDPAARAQAMVERHASACQPPPTLYDSLAEGNGR